MRTPTRASLIAPILVAVAAGSAGCSSGSSGSSSPTPSPAGPTTSHQQHGSSASSSAPTSPSRQTPSSPHPTEFNPPGDIPDNAVFIDHVAPGTKVHFSVPEGWARSQSNGVTTYTDKYNSVSIEVADLAKAPTSESARRDEIPVLRHTVPNFQLSDVTTVTRQHGHAVLVTYLMDSKPNPVTGKVVRDAVERFEFWQGGQEVVLYLSGPQNADNVDPWQIVSDSLRWG